MFLEEAMAPHPSPLAWKIPWTEEPGRLRSMGSLRVGQDWATSLSLFAFHFHTLEKEMATHSSVLAWRIPGTGEPGGLPSTGSHRVRHDWSDLAAAAHVSSAIDIFTPPSSSWHVKILNKSFKGLPAVHLQDLKEPREVPPNQNPSPQAEKTYLPSHISSCGTCALIHVTVSPSK